MRERLLNGDLPILTYHKIDTVREWGLNVVSPEKFREQMEWLRREGYRAVTFRQLEEELPDGSKPIVLTFDDGYQSVYQHAFPVLQELNFPAVVFVITGYRGAWNTWDANLGGIRFRHLDDGEIRELAQAGWEVGSHTVTHRSLIYLNDDEIRRELMDSREVLEDLTGEPVHTLAYPFGQQNARVRQQVREAGYRYGCMNLWGNPRPDPELLLKRIPVYGIDSIKNLRRKLGMGATHRLEMARLRIISWPARLTGVYQRITRRDSLSMKSN
jgi:peptidoglycan/xylan/chitin deacetylase (PgdA/CDA1 family)